MVQLHRKSRNQKPAPLLVIAAPHHLHPTVIVRKGVGSSVPVVPYHSGQLIQPIDRVGTGSTNMIQPVACSSSSGRAIHPPIIVQKPSPMGGGGVFCRNALLHGSHSMGHEQLPYTTHAPIAIQGSRINMSDMNHEGQILHIGYGHHTGVANNIRGHASICPT